MTSTAMLSDNEVFWDDEARMRLSGTTSSLSEFPVFVASEQELPSEIRELMETAPLDDPFESYGAETQQSIIRGLREAQTLQLDSFSGHSE